MCLLLVVKPVRIVMLAVVSFHLLLVEFYIYQIWSSMHGQFVRNTEYTELRYGLRVPVIHILAAKQDLDDVDELPSNS